MLVSKYCAKLFLTFLISNMRDFCHYPVLFVPAKLSERDYTSIALHFLDGIHDSLFGLRTHRITAIVDIAHGLGKDLGMNGPNISSRVLVQEGISANGHEQFRVFFKISGWIEFLEFFQS